MMRAVTVFANGRYIPRGKVVIDPDDVRTWECRVREFKHLYRRFDAWTVSEEILRQLRDLGIRRIRYVVVDRGGESYEVELSEFLKRAKPLDQSGWTKRTEEQWALPRRYWEKRESARKQLALQL